jgi:hypothetical protein
MLHDNCRRRHKRWIKQCPLVGLGAHIVSRHWTVVKVHRKCQSKHMVDRLNPEPVALAITHGTAKSNELDVPPPGAGLTMAMVSGPAVATALADTLAVSKELLTNVVGKVLAFHCTVEEGTKFDPTTLRVKPGSPCLPLLGDIAAIVGTGLEGTVGLLEEPLPHPTKPTMPRRARPRAATEELCTGQASLAALSHKTNHTIPPIGMRLLSSVVPAGRLSRSELGKELLSRVTPGGAGFIALIRLGRQSQCMLSRQARCMRNSSTSLRLLLMPYR